MVVGGKNLSFCVGSQAPFTNKNTSEKEKMLGEAPHNMWLYKEMLKDTNPRGSYFLNLTNVSQANFALT